MDYKANLEVDTEDMSQADFERFTNEAVKFLKNVDDLVRHSQASLKSTDEYDRSKTDMYRWNEEEEKFEKQ